MPHDKMQLIELVEELIELQNDHKVTAHKLTKVEQLVHLQNDLFFQALFSQKSLVEFWLSVYKSYLMIGVKAIKIMLPFVYSWLWEYGFSALTEIKSKKRERLLVIVYKMQAEA